MKIGCHISISKGLRQAAADALALGAEAFQIFTKNPRAFRGKGPSDGAEGAAFCREHGLLLVAHAPYINNLSTPDPDLHKKTVASLLHDLAIAESCAAIGLVVHCGKHVGQGPDEGIRRMIETLNELLGSFPGTTRILLENTAGQGSELGTQLEELMAIRDRAADPERIGFCFDTCHAFVAGQFTPDRWNDYVDRMRAVGYLRHLAAVHLNDAQAPFGSHRDRHANLGHGHLGESGVAAILSTAAFTGLPVVLETPVANQAAYGPEMAYGRRLAVGRTSE